MARTLMETQALITLLCLIITGCESLVLTFFKKKMLLEQKGKLFLNIDGYTPNTVSTQAAVSVPLI